MNGDRASGALPHESGWIVTVNHGSFWDAKWAWCFYAVIAALAWKWDSQALGWVAGVMTLLTLGTVWQWHLEMRMVEKALASGTWQTGQLSEGIYFEDPCWDVVERPHGWLEPDGAPPASSEPANVWKTHTMVVPLPTPQPFQVQFCNMDNHALIIRFGPHVVLSRVKSAPDRPR